MRKACCKPKSGPLEPTQPKNGPLEPTQPTRGIGFVTSRATEAFRRRRVQTAVEAAGDATPRAVPGFLPTLRRRLSRSRRSAARADLRSPRAPRGSAPVLQHRRCQRRRRLQDGVLLVPPPLPIPRVTSPSLLRELVWLMRGKHSHYHGFCEFCAAAV